MFLILLNAFAIMKMKHNYSERSMAQAFQLVPHNDIYE
jgi:hypothetical protein